MPSTMPSGINLQGFSGRFQTRLLQQALWKWRSTPGKYLLAFFLENGRPDVKGFQTPNERADFKDSLSKEYPTIEWDKPDKHTLRFT
jgi:hypothetical protein